MTVYSEGPIVFAGVSAVTANPGSNDPEVGTRARFGDEEYLWVYNTGASDLPPTYGATLSGVTGYSVTISSVTSVDMFVGVCAHSTIPAGSYGWLKTKGFATIEMGANNTATAGAILGCGTDGTFAQVASGIANYGIRVGKAMETMASGASGSAFINLF